MNKDQLGRIRYLFQHKINIHPVWDKENCEALAKLFKLDDEDLDILDEFSNFISDHGLDSLVKDRVSCVCGNPLDSNYIHIRDGNEANEGCYRIPGT